MTDTEEDFVAAPTGFDKPDQGAADPDAEPDVGPTVDGQTLIAPAAFRERVASAFRMLSMSGMAVPEPRGPWQSLQVDPADPTFAAAADELHEYACRYAWLRWMVRADLDKLIGGAAIVLYIGKLGLSLKGEFDQRAEGRRQAAATAAGSGRTSDARHATETAANADRPDDSRGDAAKVVELNAAPPHAG